MATPDVKGGFRVGEDALVGSPSPERRADPLYKSLACICTKGCGKQCRTFGPTYHGSWIFGFTYLSKFSFDMG